MIYIVKYLGVFDCGKQGFHFFLDHIIKHFVI